MCAKSQEQGFTVAPVVSKSNLKVKVASSAQVLAQYPQELGHKDLTASRPQYLSLRAWFLDAF